MFRIFGPPGTGKTTTLLNMVDKAFDEGVRPQDIAFLAFTRKAANEAKERACARFNLNPKEDLIYFRTLHSLALHLTGIRTEQIMQREHYKELSHAIGVTLMTNNIGGDDFLDLNKATDPILSIIDLARLKKIPLREQYNQSEIDEVWNTVHYVSESLTKYKKLYKLFDFTDMLELFSKKAQSFKYRFKLTFLDEAQDLSPLQWDIAHILDDMSDKMYCAGDDDQAIYRWAGADVDHFINLDGGSETLQTSFRIPAQVHEVAENISRRISNRFPKQYTPRTDSGSVKRINSLDSLDMSEGSWLVLAQSGYHLTPIAHDLRSSGYLFNYRGHRSIGEKIADAVNGWEGLRKNKEVSGKTARNIYSFMSLKERVTRGYKKLPALGDEDLVDLDTLIANHGLLAERDMIWHIAMDKLPEQDRAYIIALLRRGEKFNGDPRITVSTIHGSKGGEADNVVLFTDLSPAAEKAARDNPDDLHRVFYVGVTRTKENLFIVEPEDVSRSYEL
jgi:superfamily I DNA/RNA helicase